MTDKEIKKIIRQLKKHELSIREVPDEVKHHKEIVAAERKLGLRIEGNRGYDVIHGFFFVEEEIVWYDFSDEPKSRTQRMTFETIEDYYDYLDGDIYNQACYRFCDLGKFESFIAKNNIDILRMQERESFTQMTIEDAVLKVSEDELAAYEEVEGKKKSIKTWIKKFDECKSGQELYDVVDRFSKSKLNDVIDVSFFFYCYIFKNVDSEERFEAVMEYMCTGRYPEYKMINALCSIYGSKRVLDKYDYSSGAKNTIYKHKRRLKEYINTLASGRIVFRERCYFDNNSHYYCKSVEGYEDGCRWPTVSYQQYFETFEDFIDNQCGSLKNTDLTGALKLDVDFSLYETDSTTKLPIVSLGKLQCEVKKNYRDGVFYVSKEWKTLEGCPVKKDTFSSPYFFDFVYYLQGDLSNAFLLFCDGLENISGYEGIVFSGARLRSNLCEKIGVMYEPVNLNVSSVESFAITEKNEEETALSVVKPQNSEMSAEDNNVHGLMIEGDADQQRIYYVTDLHLMHRLQSARCKSKDDITYTLQKIVDNITEDAYNVLLIGGDVSSEYSIFELFVSLLKNKIDNKRYGHLDVIFTLGNHELWNFPNKSVEQIVSIYRELIEANGMYLLHNELLYRNSNDRLCQISYERLNALSVQEIRAELQSTRLVIFGGLGFSGHNEDFNANQDIYRATINRDEEILESSKFEELYNRLLPAIVDKNTVIFTHTPKKDWTSDITLQKDLVYVSGHNHRNEFYDDGDFRVYSDNQVGYRNNNPQLKSFLLDSEYDCFADYADGVYEITSAQYNDFYRGKNIQMSFTREVHILYMLKKNGYYCFIHKGKKGMLAMLNGGSLKRLDEKDVNYYYEHMDEMVSYIRGPLDKYMRVMHNVSEEVRKIGGSGTIHGCIVDVDWYNHIYVNPVDLTITGYFVWNIIDKVVYPNVPALLKAKCPELYGNYLKMIGNDKGNPLVPVKKKNEIGCLPVEYLSTDIYKASREIKKMQKLASNILSSWYENPNIDEGSFIEENGNK